MEGAWKLADQHGWAHHVAAQQRHSYLIPRAGWTPPVHTYANDDLLDYCGHRDIAVVAYSPLARGAVFAGGSGSSPPAIAARMSASVAPSK